MNTRDEVRQMRIREWKKVFEDKAASGLSAKEYCQQNGIGKDQYFYWQKILRESVLNEIKPNRFTELPVSSDKFFSLTAPSPITITVGKGTISVQDKESLKMVMKVLLSAQ